MDEASNVVGINNIFVEYTNFKTLYEYSKSAQHDLTKHTSLLQEELKIAKDSERASDCKKNRCQIFLSQQEEVILKLLEVKEENECLKQLVYQMEKTISDLTNSNNAEIVKKDEELQSFKQDYLKQLIKVQEVADKQVLKEKNELTSSIERLQATISKNQELLKSQDNVIASLTTKNMELKERVNSDIVFFQQKLLDQERKYQAELETWKIAELNRRVYQPLNENTKQSYVVSSLQPELFRYEHQGSIKSIQNQTTIKPYNNAIPAIPHRHDSTTSGSHQSSTLFSVGDIYFQNASTIIKKNEDKEDIHIDSVDDHNQQITETKSRNSKTTIKKRKLYSHSENLL